MAVNGKGNYIGGRPKDESKLSRKPSQIRRRLRRATQNRDKRIKYDVELYLKEVWKKPVEDWDVEELSRGRPRNSKGTFAGRPPRWINETVQAEAKRRLLKHTLGQMHGHVDKAIQCVVNLIDCTDTDDKGRPIVDARTKLAAAIFLIEHITGKPKALLELDTTGSLTRSALAAAIVLDDGKPQGHLAITSTQVVEGQVVEDGE